MTSSNEEKINKLLDFPYDAFLMVRLEYVQILGDELEAKLLRIIEKYIDMERKRIYREMINAAPANNGQVVEVTKDIWVPISYRLFMNDLFGTVTSENTVKKALKDMIKKKIIFQRFQPKKKYDAPEYKIHVNPLQTLLSMLPNPEYQKLIPSFIDTLKDLPPQELTPSECQKLIPLAALRVSKIDTNITEVTNNNREVITDESNSDDTTKPSVVSGDTAHALPGKTEAFIEKLREWRSEDEQALPSQDEQVFTDDEPQGDDHAHRVPTLPATNPAAYSQSTPPRHTEDHSDGATLPDNGLPVVRPVGSATPEQEAGRDTRDAGRDRTAQVTETPPTSMPAQSLSPSPQAEQAVLGQSTKGKSKKQAEPKPETPKGPPVAPPADMAWGTRKCLMWFDFWRGGILIGKWKLMQASTCAKGLAEQFDEQTVIQARTDMEADPYYIDKGGCDVCDVANNIHKYLKRRQGKQQPAIQPALKVVKRYSSYDDPNFRSDQDFYPVEGGSYATASR